MRTRCAAQDPLLAGAICHTLGDGSASGGVAPSRLREDAPACLQRVPRLALTRCSCAWCDSPHVPDRLSAGVSLFANMRPSADSLHAKPSGRRGDQFVEMHRGETSAKTGASPLGNRRPARARVRARPTRSSRGRSIRLSQGCFGDGQPFSPQFSCCVEVSENSPNAAFRDEQYGKREESGQNLALIKPDASSIKNLEGEGMFRAKEPGTGSASAPAQFTFGLRPGSRRPER